MLFLVCALMQGQGQGPQSEPADESSQSTKAVQRSGKEALLIYRLIQQER